MRSGKFIIISLVAILFFAGCKKSTEELFFNAERLQNEKEYTKAISVYDQLIKRNSKLQKAYFERGICYLRLKEYPKAIANFNSIINLRGGTWEFSLNEDTPFAAEEAHYQIRNIQAIKYRGIAYFFSNALDLAFTDMSNVIANNFELSNSLIWQGNISYKMGNIENSCEFFRKAKGLNDPDAEEFLQKNCNKVK